jgi:antibiotic biosynthesis monooxygenase (ABM) superfamily enzyme
MNMNMELKYVILSLKFRSEHEGKILCGYEPWELKATDPPRLKKQIVLMQVLYPMLKSYNIPTLRYFLWLP